jgi:hypothetical protein
MSKSKRAKPAKEREEEEEEVVVHQEERIVTLPSAGHEYKQDPYCSMLPYGEFLSEQLDPNEVYPGYKAVDDFRQVPPEGHVLLMEPWYHDENVMIEKFHKETVNKVTYMSIPGIKSFAAEHYSHASTITLFPVGFKGVNDCYRVSLPFIIINENVFTDQTKEECEHVIRKYTNKTRKKCRKLSLVTAGMNDYDRTSFDDGYQHLYVELLRGLDEAFKSMGF